MFDSCICVEPDEVSTILSSGVRKARREHRCCECGCRIQPGESYQVENTVFEGNLSVHKTCSICFRIRRSLFDCGWYWGQMWSEIHEAYCEEGECICPDRSAKG